MVPYPPVAAGYRRRFGVAACENWCQPSFLFLQAFSTFDSQIASCRAAQSGGSWRTCSRSLIGLGDVTLRRIVTRRGWMQRNRRPRHLGCDQRIGYRAAIRRNVTILRFERFAGFGDTEGKQLSDIVRHVVTHYDQEI